MLLWRRHDPTTQKCIPQAARFCDMTCEVFLRFRRCAARRAEFFRHLQIGMTLANSIRRPFASMLERWWPKAQVKQKWQQNLT